jgi:xylose isomerase
MVASVHPQQTLELLMQVRRDGYAGAIYFDTFPDFTGLDPIRECAVNIETVERLLAVADRLERDNGLVDSLARQDAVAAQAIVNDAIFGRAG